jgi:hypothetical protein
MFFGDISFLTAATDEASLSWKRKLEKVYKYKYIKIVTLNICV